MYLRIHNYWGQFISENPNDTIDTSTTTMLVYAFHLAGHNAYDEAEFVELVVNYTDTDGYLGYSSGDTYTSIDIQ